MTDVIAQISVTRPPGPRDWVLDAQRRFDAGDRSDAARPWTSLPRARLAVFRAFVGAFGADAREHDPQGLCRGGVMLLRVGQFFAPLPDAMKALDSLEDLLSRMTVARSAPRARAPLLDELERAVASLDDVARRDNAARPHLGAAWLSLALRVRQLVGDARSLTEDVRRVRSRIEWVPGTPAVAVNARETRSSACARLGALSQDAPTLAVLLCPPTGVAVALLMLLEIAFEVSRSTGPFDGPAGGAEYKRRCDGWGKAWARHAGLRPQRVLRRRRRQKQRT